LKVFFDTSVLVAAFWGDHPHHAPSLKALSLSKKTQATCSTHSLAEVYAVMTHLPVKPLIPAEQAMLFITDIRERLTIVPLTTADYETALRKASARGIVGGRIYDALLLHVAAKTKAAKIYTWNVDHFQHISPELSDRITTP